MLGILIATVCAIGLYRLWRPRHYGRYAYGWAGGGGGCGGGFHRHDGGGGGGHHRSHGLGRLMRELNATPEQAEVIRQSSEEIAQALQDQHPLARIDAVASALTEETFDREKLVQSLRGNQEDAFPKAMASAVERLRNALDVNQRRRLAALVTLRFGGANPPRKEGK